MSNITHVQTPSLSLRCAFAEAGKTFPTWGIILSSNTIYKSTIWNSYDFDSVRIQYLRENSVQCTTTSQGMYAGEEEGGLKKV